VHIALQVPLLAGMSLTTKPGAGAPSLGWIKGRVNGRRLVSPKSHAALIIDIAADS